MSAFKRKAAIALLLCAAFSLGNAPAVVASTAVDPGLETVAASPTPQGVKTRTVGAAVVLVAKGIRKSNKYFAKIIELIDKGATAPFLKHATKIADNLDNIATIPGLTFAVVGEKLFSALMKPPFNLSGGTANTIVQGVLGAVNLAL